jgi:hypothetical protein
MRIWFDSQRLTSLNLAPSDVITQSMPKVCRRRSAASAPGRSATFTLYAPRSRSADAKMMQSAPLESIADCVRDEEAAKQQLSTLWASTSVPTRNRCESEARSLGTTNYLDLLTCIQMAEDMKSDRRREIRDGSLATRA